MNAFQANLPELPESEAKGDIAVIYGEIRAFARVPFVALIYRYLATRPGVLPWLWGTLRPGFASGAIPDAARRLADSARLPPVAPIRAATWRMVGLGAADRASIEAVLSAYDRANPINLTVVRLIIRLLSGETAPSAPVSSAVSDGRPDRAVRPTIPELPALLPASAIPAEISAALSRLAGFVQPDAGAVTPSLYRHLAHWPAFLGLLPDRLGPYFRQGAIGRAVIAYREAAEIESAALLAAIGPLGHPPEQMPAPSIDKMRSTLDAFSALIPEMIAVGHLARAMLPREAM